MIAPVIGLGAALALALAGGLGAVARFMLDGSLRSRWAADFPWSTLLINVSGSFALGLAAGALASGGLDEELYLVVGIGFLGGFTTFSTASFDTVRLLRQHRLWQGAAYGVGGAAVCLLAAWAGLSLSS